MKAPSTIPAPHGNPQPAEGKCNLQPATCRRQLSPATCPRRPSRRPLRRRTPHFQLLKVFNFALLLSLALIACSSEELVDDNGIALREGEQLVNIRLGGLGNAAVPAGRANDDAAGIPGDGSSTPTTPGSAAENTIEELTIYSFVGITPEGTIYDETAASEGRYPFESTLERVYHYKAGAADNDMLLTADGNGYSVALPVQKDIYLRSFYVKANAGNAPTSFVAVPVFQSDGTTLSDRTNASVDNCTSSSHMHSDLKDDKLALPTTNPADAIRPPLPASGIAIWREELTGGYFEEHDMFAAADLAKGLTVNLSRWVTRFDINNPATTGFTITGISANNVDYKQCTLFGGSTSGTNRSALTLNELPLTNATSIPAALYIPYGYYSNGSSDQLDIVIHGTFHGVETVLHAKTESYVNPNTRYVVNIINSGSTVAASLSLADWTDDGTNIDSDDLFGTLNSGATLAVESGATNYIEQDGNEITVLYPNLYYNSKLETYKAFTITGTAGNTKPVGIIIPGGVKWLAVDKGTEATTGTYSVSLNVVPGEITARDEYYWDNIDQRDKTVLYGAPPETVTLTLVTQETVDGKNVQRNHEYRVTREWYLPNDPNLDSKLAPSGFILPSGATLDASTRTITLPPFQVGAFYNGNDGSHFPFLFGGFLLTDQSWLHPKQEQDTDGNINILFAIDNNFQSSSPRSATLTTRTWNATTGKIITEDYTVTQTAGNFDPALLTTDVSIVGIDPYDPDGNQNLPHVQGDNITIPAGHSQDYPLSGSPVFLASADEKGFVATVTSGGDWLRLTGRPYEAAFNYLSAYDGKYLRGIRILSNAGSTAAREGKIKILYRDSDGNITSKTITVTQEAGAGTL